MNKTWMAGLGLALVAQATPATSAVPGSLPMPLAPAARAETEFQKLSAEFATASAEWRTKATEARAKKEKVPPRPELEFWPRFEKIAATGDRQALTWCLQYASRAGLKNDVIDEKVVPMYGKLADALLTAAPGKDEMALGDVVQYVLGGGVRAKHLKPEEAVAIFKKIEANAKDEDARGAALLQLRVAEMGEVSDEVRDQKMVEVYRDVLKKYPNSGAGKEAKGQINRLENLVIGKVAPDFSTTDVEGVDFKLSDYRGKVVVLDFWGFW